MGTVCGLLRGARVVTVFDVVEIEPSSCSASAHVRPMPVTRQPVIPIAPYYDSLGYRHPIPEFTDQPASICGFDRIKGS